MGVICRDRGTGGRAGLRAMRCMEDNQVEIFLRMLAGCTEICTSDNGHHGYRLIELQQLKIRQMRRN